MTVWPRQYTSPHRRHSQISLRRYSRLPSGTSVSWATAWVFSLLRHRPTSRYYFRNGSSWTAASQSLLRSALENVLCSLRWFRETDICIGHRLQRPSLGREPQAVEKCSLVTDRYLDTHQLPDE